jgi:signal transduction histidine kinase
MNDVFEKENIIVEDRIEDLEIKADKNLIELVIVNLIKNAIDSLQFTDNKKLAFSCNKSSQLLTLSVSDNGKGIPKDIMDQIFVPFFSTKETGSGIGLSVAKQIMQMHQGKIEVKSDKSITTFTLVFQQS